MIHTTTPKVDTETRPPYDFDAARDRLARAYDLACAQCDKARAAYYGSSEYKGEYDPFANDLNGPRFLAYCAACDVAQRARYVLETYDEDVRMVCVGGGR